MSGVTRNHAHDAGDVELEELCAALRELPLDWDICAEHLRLIDVNTSPLEAQRMRHDALMAAVEPQFADRFTPAHADEILNLIERFSILRSARIAERQRCLDAIDAARELLNEFGIDDQQVQAAVIDAINLADPAIVARRIAAIAGIH